MTLPYFDALKACVNKHLPKFSYIGFHSRQSEEALLGQNWSFGLPCLLVGFGTITAHASNPNPTVATNIALHVFAMLYDISTSTSDSRKLSQLTEQLDVLFNDFSFVAKNQEGATLDYGGDFVLDKLTFNSNHPNLIAVALIYKTKLLKTAILKKKQLTVDYSISKGYTYAKPAHHIDGML